MKRSFGWDPGNAAMTHRKGKWERDPGNRALDFQLVVQHDQRFCPPHFSKDIFSKSASLNMSKAPQNPVVAKPVIGEFVGVSAVAVPVEYQG